MDVTKNATVKPANAKPYTDVWWHRPWVKATEGALWHIVAVVLGVVMMVVGLALGVTIVMLPVGIVVGLFGLALLVGGLFAHVTKSA